jgi:hypothetical protein
MTNERNLTPDPNEPAAYQIRLRGQLGSEWAGWFGGLSITLDADGNTLLISPAIDQAALHGLLKKVRDLGLSLISINPVEPDQAAVTAVSQNQSVEKGNEE